MKTPKYFFRAKSQVFLLPNYWFRFSFVVPLSQLTKKHVDHREDQDQSRCKELEGVLQEFTDMEFNVVFPSYEILRKYKDSIVSSAKGWRNKK